MTDLEKGYVAGLIDGEGTVTLLKDRADAKFKYPVVEMTSTTYALVERMKEICGGTISNQKVYKENYKQSYKWCIRGDKAIILLTEIKNYLLEPNKNYRANLIVNEYKTVTPRNGKYSEEMLEKKLDFEKRFFI
jgi:hypothetical protein